MDELIVSAFDVQEEVFIVVRRNLAKANGKALQPGNRASKVLLERRIRHGVFKRENQSKVRRDRSGERIKAIAHREDLPPLDRAFDSGERHDNAFWRHI